MADENKSVLGSIAGTFKSELKNNVLGKLGPDLGSAIEKGLEAKADGKNFKDTFSSEYKNKIGESLKDKIFGQGIIGKSLRSGFESKFGSGEEADTNDPVMGSAFNDFSDGVFKSIEDEQGVLIRIETLATNISDNVYNITAAWSKNAKTLEETRKVQEEQHKLEMMSAEEAAIEAKSKLEPLSKPTPTGKENEKPGTGLLGISNMFSGLLKSAGKLKSSLLGILKSKKFIALAALTIGSSAAAAILSNQGSNSTINPNTELPPEKLDSQPEPTKINPVITQQDKQEAERETEKLLKLSKTRDQTTSITNNVTNQNADNVTNNVTNQNPTNVTNNVTNQSNNLNVSSTTQVSKPPLSTATPRSAIAPTSSSNDSDVQRLNDYFQKPENVADGVKVQELSQQEQTIKEAIKKVQKLSEHSITTPSEKARYEYLIKNRLEPSLQLVTNQKQEIINKAEQATKSLQTTSSSSNVSAPTPIKSTPSASPGPTASGMGSSSTPAGSSSMGESGPTMMENSPTSGSNIAANSEAVESSASKPNQPTVTNIDNSSQNMESREGKTRKGIPSPVANRGSLDSMAFFRG